MSCARKRKAVTDRKNTLSCKLKRACWRKKRQREKNSNVHRWIKKIINFLTLGLITWQIIENDRYIEGASGKYDQTSILISVIQIQKDNYTVWPLFLILLHLCVRKSCLHRTPLSWSVFLLLLLKIRFRLIIFIMRSTNTFSKNINSLLCWFIRALDGDCLSNRVCDAVWWN